MLRYEFGIKERIKYNERIESMDVVSKECKMPDVQCIAHVPNQLRFIRR